MENLLFRPQTKSFTSGDEREVVGYTDVMDIIFNGGESITLTKCHIKQLDSVLLKYSN